MHRFKLRFTLFLTAVLLSCGLFWLSVLSTRQFKKDRLLYAAVESNNINMVRLLLESGANPNVCEHREPEMAFKAEGFFQKLARLFSRDKHGSTKHTALMLAASHGQSTIVDLLLKHGASINAMNDTGESDYEGTALFSAIYSSQNNIVCQLLSAGADPNVLQTGNGGWTMGLAVDRHCNGKAIHALLKHGAIFDVHSSSAVSLVRETFDHETTDDISVMLDSGISMEASNNYGSLLEQAIEVRNANAVRMLLDRGAKLTTRNAYNQTVLGQALSHKLHDGFAPSMVKEQNAKMNAVIKLLKSRGAKE